MTLRQRQPRVKDAAFLAFVRTRKCCVCGRWPTHAAHVKMGCPERGKRPAGAGEKSDDRWAVPLCPGCHQDDPGAQHRVGDEEKFWRVAGVDPFQVAADLYAEFKGELP